MEKVVVVLPAYNEEASLGPLLSDFEKLPKGPVEYLIIAINDGSTDRTEEILKSHQAKLPLRIVRHQGNMGLGPTIKTGLKTAINLTTSPDDVIICMDADNTHSPHYIPPMIEAIRVGADIVIASRYLSGSKELGVPWWRKFLSRGAHLLFSLLVHYPGIKDYTCGFRAYRAELIKIALERFGDDIIIRAGFACTDELLLNLLLFRPRISEIPFVLRYDKKKGKSKLKLPLTIKETIKMLLKFRTKLMERR